MGKFFHDETLPLWNFMSCMCIIYFYVRIGNKIVLLEECDIKSLSYINQLEVGLCAIMFQILIGLTKDSDENSHLQHPYSRMGR